MPELMQLPSFSDERGSLSVLDHKLPFIPQRIYWIYANLKSLPRGGHRHHKCRQILVAVHGECKIFCDDSQNTSEFHLCDPGRALLVEPKDWHVMHSFSPDCVLLVVSSEKYRVEDYIDEPYREVPSFV